MTSSEVLSRCFIWKQLPSGKSPLTNSSNRSVGKRGDALFIVHSLRFFLLPSFDSSQGGESHEVGKSYSVRRECLDHQFILQEKQLHRVLRAYVQYFNQARPHQGIKQQIPDHYGEPGRADREDGKILALPVLGGLHHDYCRSA